MTPWQTLAQTRHRAKSITDYAGSLLFGESGALIALDFPVEQIGRLPNRAVLITCGADEALPGTPQLAGHLDVELLVFASDLTDPFGRDAVRVVLDACDRLIADLGNSGNMGGLRMVPVRRSAARVIPVSPRPLVYRGITMRAHTVGTLATDDRLPPVTGLSAVNNAGTVTVSWTRPQGYATRFDYLGVIVRRKTGSAPSSVTDGTSVQVATDNASVAEAPGAGTWYYAAFVAYDENLDAAADEYSSAASGSVTV